MTTISPKPPAYAAGYAASMANAQHQKGQPASAPPPGATNVTLSEAAKAAMQAKDFATVTAEARANLTALLAGAGLESPLKDGRLAADLSKTDRRELFAIASNAGQGFSADEQRAAAIELRNRFDATLAGPAAVARVTDDIKGLYTAALACLDAMGPEEKASAAWADQKSAVDEALKQFAADPRAVPTGIAHDPVTAYLARVETGDTGKPRDFTSVTADVRAALDRQYADARAAGKDLVFSARRTSGQQADLSAFDSRALSAIALNNGGKFSETEALAAQRELRARSGAAVLAGLKHAGSSGDPAAFAKNLISVYGSMSGEERQAAGWSSAFYDTVLANYQTSTKIAQMFAAGPGGSMSLMNRL